MLIEAFVYLQMVDMFRKLYEKRFIVDEFAILDEKYRSS